MIATSTKKGPRNDLDHLRRVLRTEMNAVITHGAPRRRMTDLQGKLEGGRSVIDARAQAPGRPETGSRGTPSVVDAPSALSGAASHHASTCPRGIEGTLPCRDSKGYCSCDSERPGNIETLRRRRGELKMKGWSPFRPRSRVVRTTNAAIVTDKAKASACPDFCVRPIPLMQAALLQSEWRTDSGLGSRTAADGSTSSRRSGSPGRRD